MEPSLSRSPLLAGQRPSSSALPAQPIIGQTSAEIHPAPAPAPARKYDIAILGCGRYGAAVAAEVLRLDAADFAPHPGDVTIAAKPLRVALAGRDAEKLAAVRMHLLDAAMVQSGDATEPTITAGTLQCY